MKCAAVRDSTASIDQNGYIIITPTKHHTCVNNCTVSWAFGLRLEIAENTRQPIIMWFTVPCEVSSPSAFP